MQQSMLYSYTAIVSSFVTGVEIIVLLQVRSHFMEMQFVRKPICIQFQLVTTVNFDSNHMAWVEKKFRPLLQDKYFPLRKMPKLKLEF